MSDWNLIESHAEISKLHRRAQKLNPAYEMLREREGAMWVRSPRPAPNSGARPSRLRSLAAALASLLKSS